MKRLLFILTLLFLTFFAQGQGYPITQNLGSGNTLVQVPANGGFKASLINRSFADTTAANATPIDFYAGSQIVTADNEFWVRNQTATAWISISNSSNASITNIYNNSIVTYVLLNGDSCVVPTTGGGLAIDTICFNFVVCSVRFLTDSTFLACPCDTTSALCDTGTFNPTPLYIFQNGITQTAPGVVEWGGSLSHRTEITQGGYDVVFTQANTGAFFIHNTGTFKPADLLLTDDNGGGVWIKSNGDIISQSSAANDIKLRGFGITPIINLASKYNGGIEINPQGDGNTYFVVKSLNRDSIFKVNAATDKVYLDVDGAAGTSDSALVRDPTTKEVVMKEIAGGGVGTVTDFIFTDANGFDGTVSTSTTTPTLSLTTTVSDAQLFYSTSGALTGDANITRTGSGTINVTTSVTSAAFLTTAVALGGGSAQFRATSTQGILLRSTSSDIAFYSGSSNPAWAIAGSNLATESSRLVTWNSTVNGAFGGGADVGIGRNAAGVLEANSGVLGTLRDMRVRTLFAGTAGSVIGTISIAGNSSGVISILPQAAAGTYNFNLPTTAGTSGYLLTSGGGGATAMTWTDPATVGGITADNGLTENTTSNVRLGGTLLQNTTVNSGGFTMNFNGSTTTPLAAASSTANAISAVASGSGGGVSASSSSGIGLYGLSTSGIGVQAQTLTGTYALAVSSASAGTGDVDPIISIERGGNGTSADGFGTSIQFRLETTPGFSGSLSNELISKWTTAATASRTSQFIITGVTSASTQDIIYFEGNGRTRFNGRAQFTQGADVASAAGAIALGLDGNSFEITGTSAITLISNLNWQNGSEVTLIFTSTASLTDGTANSGTDIGMELAGNTNFTGSAGATITLKLLELGGTQRWYETARSVN